MVINRIPTLILVSLVSLQASAANIVIQNNDGVDEGFNDPNPPLNANQKGNNPGTTLGEMRLKVFEEAAKVWGGILNSNVAITVGAQFSELGCSADSGTLGSAGTNGSIEGFTGSKPSTAYPIALAESLKNSNINGNAVEIFTTFNSAVDSGDPDCLGGEGFYYGLDENAPVGTSPLFPVVLHELAHGLGFASLADFSPDGSGNFTGAGGFPDVFSRNLLDLDTGKSWDQMNGEERKVSALNEPDLVWKGAKVAADSHLHLGSPPELVINTPEAITGIFDVVLGGEPTIVMPENGATGDVVDGNAFTDIFGDPMDGCVPFNFGLDFAGKVVLFDLPDQDPETDEGCHVLFLAKHAQEKNAIGVVIANTDETGLPNVSGQFTTPQITIPYVGAEKSIGTDLRANLALANATIRNSLTKFIGENQGKLMMYAPVTFRQGSSVSHWSLAPSPDLLMEAFLNRQNFDNTDLTAAAFQDIGWSVNIPGGVVELIYKDGFEN